MRTDPHRLRFLVQVPLFATWLLAGATSHASAQGTARNFQELGLKVKAGDTVYITDDSGKQEQEAQILELTPSLLVVSVGGVRRDLSEGNLSRIRQRLPDSRKNGALIGFLVGASGSTAGAVSMASPSGSCKGAALLRTQLTEAASARSSGSASTRWSKAGRTFASGRIAGPHAVSRCGRLHRQG